jgi:hypothetical protein
VLVVRVVAEEVDGWNLKLFLAVIACLLVEGTGSLFHGNDLSLHRVNALHVILHLVVVFIDALHLSLQFFNKELLEDFESQHVGLGGGLALQSGPSFLLLLGVLGV